MPPIVAEKAILNTNALSKLLFFGLTLLVLLLEKIYKYPSLKILDSIILVIGFRIFLTRFVSWFINDIDVEIDPDTGVPYDTVLYESIFEGLVPMVICWILKNKLKVENSYLDPLSLLQILLMKKLSNKDITSEEKTALLLSINGLAAGLRNTG